MKDIYVLDAVNYLFRSYYAIAPMTNDNGESTNALFGFIRSVLKIIKDFAPSHVVAVFDGPDNAKSRKELYPEYKAHRTGMPEDLFPQLEWAQGFCEKAGIPFICIPGVEADDVMGSIAKWYEEKGVTTYLCSSDKDLCQLVTNKTFVLNTFKEHLLMDRKKVFEKYGIYPEQMIDYLALTGDASDNIPGLEGIGPKTAVSLLTEYKTLEKVLANADKIKGKRGEVIARDKDVARLSQKLATIDTSIPFPKEDNFSKLKTPDLEQVRTLYQEMRFLSLLKELAPPEKAPAEELPLDFGKEMSYTLVNSEAELKALITKLETKRELCIDTETTSLDVMDVQLVGVGLSDAPKRGWYIPLNGTMKFDVVIKHLKPLLENSKIAFFGQNIKYDLHVLLRVGIQVANIGFDTMLASYLLSPQKQSHGLDTLTLELFHKVKTPITDLIGKGKKERSMLDVPIEKVSNYCCEDVDYTYRLKEHFSPKLKQENLDELMFAIELPLVPVLLDMEERGIYIDKTKMGQMQTLIVKQLEKIKAKIFSLAGKEFNLNSPRQLGTILFEKMEIRPAKKTKTGYSTSADVLESLRDKSPIIPIILEYRALEKLRSTYLETLPTQVQKYSDRIHCTFNQTVTSTGRLSCQDPNLQNIPVRSEEGRKIRTAFQPQLANWSYVSGDYSQIELRILAHLSEDPTLIKAFRQGEDIHTFTASLVYDVPVKQVTNKMRYSAKAVNFGILYGQQAFGLSRELGISNEEAKAFITTYFKRYSKVRDYLEFSKESVRKLGYSLTLFGRKRPIPEIDSKNAFLRQAAERLAVNTPLQGTSADLIKLAMIDIHERVRQRKYQSYMILQIHDELIFESPDKEVKEIKTLLKERMEKIRSLKIPLVVDISVGKNWGEC